MLQFIHKDLIKILQFVHKDLTKILQFVHKLWEKSSHSVHKDFTKNLHFVHNLFTNSEPCGKVVDHKAPKYFLLPERTVELINFYLVEGSNRHQNFFLPIHRGTV